jgi:hypothetical protein
MTRERGSCVVVLVVAVAIGMMAYWAATQTKHTYWRPTRGEGYTFRHPRVYRGMPPRKGGKVEERQRCAEGLTAIGSACYNEGTTNREGLTGETSDPR